MTTDLDAIEASVKAEKPGTRFVAPSTVLALIAELRQERERADDNERSRKAHQGARTKVEAALSRAEETIEKVRAEYLAVTSATKNVKKLWAIQDAITEYDKQKEADHD